MGKLFSLLFEGLFNFFTVQQTNIVASKNEVIETVNAAASSQTANVTLSVQNAQATLSGQIVDAQATVNSQIAGLSTAVKESTDLIAKTVVSQLEANTSAQANGFAQLRDELNAKLDAIFGVQEGLDAAEKYKIKA
jgi:hypothetical protein